jgi:hypothetical protein
VVRIARRLGRVPDSHVGGIALRFGFVMKTCGSEYLCFREVVHCGSFMYIVCAGSCMSNCVFRQCYCARGDCMHGDEIDFERTMRRWSLCTCKKREEVATLKMWHQFSRSKTSWAAHKRLGRSIALNGEGMASEIHGRIWD